MIFPNSSDETSTTTPAASALFITTPPCNSMYVYIHTSHTATRITMAATRTWRFQPNIGRRVWVTGTATDYGGAASRAKVSRSWRKARPVPSMNVEMPAGQTTTTTTTTITKTSARVKNAEAILEKVRNNRMAETVLMQNKAKGIYTISSSPTSGVIHNARDSMMKPFSGSALLKDSTGQVTSSSASSSTLDTSSFSATVPIHAQPRQFGNRYDPQLAAQFFKTRAMEVRKRQFQIAVPLVTFIGKVVLDWQRGLMEVNRSKRAKEFLQIIESLGPAFVKAGQALSSRPDLLPPEYLEELQKLQDRLSPFPNDVAFAVIEQELGDSIENMFHKIEPEPVAAASIGQVYKAYLKVPSNAPIGTKPKAVAIKVQRPDCEQIVAMDIFILRNLSGLLSRMLSIINRNINLQSVIEEFGKLIYEEIDYVSEAVNADRFRALYGQLPDVYVPRVYWRYSSRKVLTMDWVVGKRLTSKELGNYNTKLVKTLVDCSLRQILSDPGFFHADPHGGNLLATPNGELCYLDFGMMSQVEPHQRFGIIEAVIHLVNRDFEALANLYVRLGFLPVDTDLEPIIAALNDALPDVLGASVSELNFKSVIDKLGSVMYKFPFNLPPYYTAIIRCLGVLEGLAIQVDPEFKILNEAYPFIAQRLLSDPAPELQGALEVLLFKDGQPRWNRLENLMESASKTSDYDYAKVAEFLVDFILSKRGEKLRYHLADTVIDEVDAWGLDTTNFYMNSLSQSLSSMGIPIPGTKSRPTMKEAQVSTSKFRNDQGTEDRESNRKTLNLLRLVSAIAQSNAITAPNIAKIVRKALAKPEGQRLGVEIGVGIAERVTSRIIRMVFDIPEKDASAKKSSLSRRRQKQQADNINGPV